MNEITLTVNLNETLRTIEDMRTAATQFAQAGDGAGGVRLANLAREIDVAVWRVKRDQNPQVVNVGKF